MNFTADSYTVTVGETVQTTVASLNIGAVTYESSDVSIVTVDQSGVLTGVKEGSATVTARAACIGGKSSREITDTCAVSVKKAPASLAFKSDFFDTGVDKQLQLEITSRNTRNIEYSSSDESIATVSATGAVTPVKLGQVTITATAQRDDGGSDTVLTDSCTVYVNPSEYATLDGKERCIKWTGRNFTLNGTVNCYNTASGFETVFYGTELNAIITAAGDRTPQLTVLIDDENDYDARKVDLTKTKTTKSYTLISGLVEGRHTARIYKITEPLHSSVSFSAMETDGYFMTPPATKSLKLEIYGDSITVGHTILCDTASDPSNANSVDKMQNGCMTYAWLAAQNLNAEINVEARTGVGLNWSWGAPFVMKDNWTKTYMAESDFLHSPAVNPAWDFESYIPDAVLINIGTNDTWNTSGYNAAEYRTSLRTMASGLIEKYGAETKIVFLYGMMTVGNADDVNRVANELCDQGFAVSAKQLSGNKAGHPRVSHNITAGDELTQYLETLLF